MNLSNRLATEQHCIQYAQDYNLNNKLTKLINEDVIRKNLIFCHYEYHYGRLNRLFFLKILTLIKILILPFYFAAKIRGFANTKKEYVKGFRLYKKSMLWDKPIENIDNLYEKDNQKTIYCIEGRGTKKIHKELKKRNYDHVSLDNITKHITPKTPIRLIRLFKNCIKLFMLCVREPYPVTDAVFKYLYHTFVWEEFLSKYSIKEHHAYNNYNASAVARNIILNKNKIHTVHHMQSVNEINKYFDWSGEFPSIKVPYLNYSQVNVWHPMDLCFWLTDNKVAMVKVNGCPWTKHIKKHQNKNLVPVVAIFDDSYKNTETIKSVGDGIKFLEDVTKLLNSHKVVAIFKPKRKPNEVHPEYKKAMLKFMSHPNVLVTYNDIPTVISKSDFVISVAYSTGGAVAQANNTSMIYYDPSGQFKTSPYCDDTAYSYSELDSYFKNFLSR